MIPYPMVGDGKTLEYLGEMGVHSGWIRVGMGGVESERSHGVVGVCVI